MIKKLTTIFLLLIFTLSCAYVHYNPKTQDFKYCNFKKLSVDIKYKNPQTGEEFSGSLTSDPSPYIELMKYAFEQGFAAASAGK
jgi:hypothetical protein